MSKRVKAFLDGYVELCRAHNVQLCADDNGDWYVYENMMDDFDIQRLYDQVESELQRHVRAKSL